jgi:hypothetical protein
VTGSAQSTSQPAIVCSICAGPIPLEASRTDEHGKAVHEECYVRETISRFNAARSVPKSARKNLRLLIRKLTATRARGYVGVRGGLAF